MPMIPVRPAGNGDGLTRWALLAAATAVAGFLLFFYVQLLNDSVTRGAHWRYSQTTLQSGATVPPSVQMQLVGSNR